MQKEEKKVEYLELIYDLIFVYIIGRNNALLRNVEGGFVTGSTFLVYVFCTLAVIQIWNFSTYYINMHGRNGLRDHIALLLNMYLLYYLGEGIGPHWDSYQKKFHFAWALILINLGIQYAIELREHRGHPMEERSIKRMMLVLFVEAAMVLAVLPVYEKTGIFLAGAPILYGIAMTRIFSDENKAEIAKYQGLAIQALQAGNEGDAKIFLAKKQNLETVGASLETAYAVAHENATKMSQLHDKLTADIAQLQAKKQAIKAKVSIANTQETVNKYTGTADKFDKVMGEFEKMEQKADKMLDIANAKAELEAEPIDEAAAIEAKYQAGMTASVDDELARLKEELGL